MSVTFLLTWIAGSHLEGLVGFIDVIIIRSNEFEKKTLLHVSKSCAQKVLTISSS